MNVDYHDLSRILLFDVGIGKINKKMWEKGVEEI